MKKSFIASAFLIAVNFCSIDNFAQCSDAGICQIGGYLAEGEDINRFSLSALYKYGYSGKDYDIQYHSFMMEGMYYLLDNSTVQFLFPYNIQSGPAGTVNGIGDLIISWNQNLYSYKGSSLSASLGVKLPTGKDNQDNLPQALQSGLGTTDMLIGLNCFYNKLNIGAGYQLSGGRNNNLYRLEKGDDILLRAAYEFLIADFTVIPELLYIQPTSKSSILAQSYYGGENFIEVDKSNKSQINLLTEIRYRMGDDYSLLANFAVPFIKREINVDGLTRAYSASLGLAYLF